MNIRFRGRWTVLLGWAPIILASAGCATGPKIRGPIRAIWVTRFDYKSPGDVVRIMDDCSSAGLNTVLFQVRGNGTVFYPSRIEPWTEQFDFHSPGFDPLALAIKEAHRHGMQLHAWVNVMPAWQGPGEPKVRNQLYHSHPEWFWYDETGRRQPWHHEVGEHKRDWYVSLNPCLPEVRSYLTNVFRDLVSRYDVDGLHMDYIRFPNEPVVSGERIPDYPRDRRTLALFKQDTGHTPQSNGQIWNKWRADQVTRLVADVHRMMRLTKPEAVLSAAVGSVPKNALSHFQDSRRWINDGIIDVLYLMNYTPELGEFESRIRPWMNATGQCHIVPGLMVRDGGEPRADADRAASQIEIARSTTGHFCIFAYSSIFNSRDSQLTAQSDPVRQKRAQRRAALVPFLRSLAQRPPTA